MYKYIPSIAIETLAYSLNFFFPTLLLVFASLSKNYELSSELGIVISVSYLVTQIFSANTRSIIMSKENNYKLLNYSLYYRFCLSNIFILGFLYFALSSTIILTNKFLLINISILIILQWVTELILLRFELKKKSNFIFYFVIIYTSLFILFLITILLSYKFSKYIIIVINISLLLLIIYHVSLEKIKLHSKMSFKKVIINYFLGYSFLSSFFIQFTNLIWRIMILIYCGKVIAGIYFSSFAFGSLISTVFNVSFGPTLHKKKINMKYIYKKIIIFYIFFIFISVLIWSKFLFSVNLFQSNLFFFSTAISLIGSLFMLKAASDRQKFILINKNKVFKLDLLCSFFLILLIPTLNFVGGKMLIMISFFISSLISYFVFSIFLKKNYQINP